MAWHYGKYGEPIYVPTADPRYHLRDGDIFYPDPAPVTFRTAPFYSDAVQYRSSFRDQHPHFGHGVELVIPAGEEVHIRREDPYPRPYYPFPSTAPPPRWLDEGVRDDIRRYRVHPGGAWVLERRRPDEFEDDDDDDDCTLEFYAPQLGSDSRERKVKKALEALPGVERVDTDQWLLKVVVKGSGLCEDQVLRRLRRVEHMDRSVFWRDRV